MVQTIYYFNIIINYFLILFDLYLIFIIYCTNVFFQLKKKIIHLFNINFHFLILVEYQTFIYILNY